MPGSRASSISAATKPSSMRAQTMAATPRWAVLLHL
ncbi:Uncharacterised protein [Bordetella pertussis]|nr:Uncharacterised protein [Bordetella pertussis]CFW46287.1 Uncharacterised protein [Bordetella pertussis]